MAPIFHPGIIEGFARDMTDSALRAVDQWRDGTTVDVAHEMMRITMAIAGKTLFSADTFSDADELGEALTVALTWGWIDGQKRALDDTHWLQKFTPRKPKSLWSKINRDKALALIASGAMQPAGLAEVERAQADGRWDAAYAGSKTITVPDDLAAALAADKRAAARFATLNAANRFAVLFRVHTAKKAETRAKRIAQFVAMLARGETLHP